MTSSNGVNPALTFDTLVAGRSNQTAMTAALHVASAPGALYSPLYIYAGVGLGKTHLLHAVGNQLLKDNPKARVLYQHTSQFVSRFVKSMQHNSVDQLRTEYGSLDLLLVDDVQFLADKPRFGEEFFNIFEALMLQRTHIIMTGDTHPKSLAGIDERMISRFNSGLTLPIEPPELGTRVTILLRKAKAIATPLPAQVAFFIAENIRTDVRELEGALYTVTAYSHFLQKEINLALAREALKDFKPHQCLSREPPANPVPPPGGPP